MEIAESAIHLNYFIVQPGDLYINFSNRIVFMAIIVMTLG